MKSVAVLQARTNSSRLPGKVLLPINGLPVVVLAARRAANTGREVVVATSIAKSDDGLAAVLGAHGLQTFRGSLENTLQRIVDALESFGDETLVFRLTADNVFPDGSLLDEMEREFLSKNLDYYVCNGESSGLPYGMSVELTRLKYLRDANSQNLDAFDREHVTPYIARKYGVLFFKKYLHMGMGHFRCTIDCLDDYLCVQDVFAMVENVESVSAFELLKKLATANLQPTVNKPVGKLVLGTAQLGVDYGVANTIGRPSRGSSCELIKTAIANGVKYLDTARAYGCSEAVIGDALKAGWQGRVEIITKLSPLKDLPADASKSVVNAFVDSSIFESMTELRAEKIEVLLLHRASQLVEHDALVWQRLLELQRMGRLGKLGVSVQTPAELESALSIDEVAYIQMPMNILDWRWDGVVEKIETARSKKKLVIHARSAFLQGLVLSSNVAHWHRAHVGDSTRIQSWLIDCVRKFHRDSIADLCIAYVNSLSWIDGVAVGMESLNQLQENMLLFGNSNLTLLQIEEINQDRPRLPEISLDPAHWKR